MSHFTVLVIGDNPEEQLAPYQENNMGDCPKEYLEFVDVTDECKEDYKEYQSNPNKFVEYIRSRSTSLSFDNFVEEYHGYDKNPETQKYGYWVNPNAKWDWYILGGRWTGYFKLKEGKTGTNGKPGLFSSKPNPGYADQALKGDIDFVSMTEKRMASSKKCWKEAEVKSEGDRYWRYGIRKDESESEYIKRNSSLSTYAVVKDGVWYEKGEMGWFGNSINEKDHDTWESEFNSILESLPDDTLLSLYDCHI